jgi:uncharacterized iron-regulated protein
MLFYKSRFPWPRACAVAVTSAFLLLASGCAGRPEAPILEQTGSPDAAQTALRLAPLLHADVLLVGEQHDAQAHHAIEQQIVSSLAVRSLLAALALEMAESGVSTARLKPSSTEEQTRSALKWDEKAWPWADYGPAVMTAVRAGVPVLDAQLPGPALKAQQQAIRIGHCNLLPEGQITPLTRVQIARDITMADTLHQLALPGKTVVLLTGNGHADRQLGVPQHLRADLKARSLHLRAGEASSTDRPEAFDSVWATPALPDTDHCAELEAQLPAPAAR